MWSHVDAINLALDALNAHEITSDQLDQYTNELWHDMAAENEAEQGYTKEDMERFILKRFPKAELVRYWVTSFGSEYLFYRNEDAADKYACVVKDGHLEILTEF